jgi:DNA polymerase III sliding clamp (beta) subunit (PCNA family)
MTAKKQEKIDKFLFYLETSNGFVLKVLTEFLMKYTNNIQPSISKDGIQISQIVSDGNQMFKIFLPSKNFINYKCSEKLDIGINTESLNKLLKRVRKKDSMTMFMKSQNELCMTIVPQENQHSEGMSKMNVVRAQTTDITEPEGYSNPINISGKDFQKDMKELKDAGRLVEVFSDNSGGSIRMSCSEEGLYYREKIYGLNDDDEKEHSPVEESSTTFCKHYTISVFTSLEKLLRLSPVVSLYVSPNCPLRMDLQMGNLGTMSVFIKSEEEMKDS